MTATFGTRELALRHRDGIEERIPLALLEAAMSSLNSDELIERIRLWTQGRPTSEALVPEPLPPEVELELDIVVEFERDLVKYASIHGTEEGLLTIASDEARGLLLSGETLPSTWATVPAHTVLALALRRFCLLTTFDTKLLLVDIATAGSQP